MVGKQKQTDPWGQVEDINGDALYHILRVNTRAKSDEIKKSYRNLARIHHPDKGGDSVVFSRIQHAYEVLSDPKRRQVYDVWAKELQFRYVRPAGTRPLGGEDILLNELDDLGLKCDPLTQLVVTCEVCRRPATKQCWTCSMHICEFCTLKRHWKDGIPLHWPLINSDHMRERLAKRELEKKISDDAKRIALEDPNHRTETELQNIRAFKEAAYELLQYGDEKRRTTYDLRLAKFYMWAQTWSTVFIACRVPTGYEDRELVVECSGTTLLIQSEDSPAIVDRYLAHGVDTSQPIEILRTADNRIVTVAVPKSEMGQHWGSLFRGDPHGARCIEPPYSLLESDDDVIMNIELPFWIDPGDIKINVGESVLDIRVRNTMHLWRKYWRNVEEEQRRAGDYKVIEQSSWCLEEDIDSVGDRCKLLTVTLVRPPPTEEEITWKKGRRQDNRAALRPGSMIDRGFRFFNDDEDEFGLEEILQALCFAQTGKAYIAPKPWASVQDSRWARNEAELPPTARQLLHRLRTEEKSSL